MNTHALSRIATVAAAGALMAGCAAPKNPDPRDPWEGFNRGVYKFNDSVDRVVFKPVAQAYTYVTPQPVRSCVHNIFSNVGDLWSGANSMLQGRGHDFVNTLGRFLFNTTMGVGGCFDVASANGARKIPNDFGTTLGVWGIGQGPYRCCRSSARPPSATASAWPATSTVARPPTPASARSTTCRCAIRCGA